jgi:tetratricopeptide (TPR) repeat protein
MRLIKQLIPFLFLLLGICLFSIYCQNPGEAVSESPYLNHHDSVTYVGKQQCRACHSEIYNTFIETGMGKSFGVASKLKSAARFGHQALYDKQLDFYYLPFWKGDSMFIKEFRLKGKDTVYQRTERVDYIIGSGQHTNSHLTEINGYLYQMPLTWYAQQGKWDLPPGFENGRNVRFSRAIEMECMSCHNAIPKLEEGSLNKFVSIPDGIDCERCHGPGSLHVQEKLKGIVVDTANEIDYTIVNPRKLSWERQIDVCQRCHLQGNTVLKEGKKFTDFKPGMVLSNYMEVFMPKYKGRDDEFIMASHAQRLQLSKCFISSNKQSSQSDTKGFEQLSLTCINCHNPHVSVKVTGKQIFNNACLKCHGNNACKDIPKNIALQNNNCVACHMPRSGSVDIPHVTVHDHKIAKPANKLELAKIRQYQGLYCVNASSTSIESRAKAYLNYYEKFEGEMQSLDSSKWYLSQLKGTGMSLDLWVHLLYLNQEWQKLSSLISKKEYEAAALKDAWTSYRIGQGLQNVGRFEEALTYYNRSLILAPRNLEWKNKKGVLLIQLGRNAEGAQLLKESLALQPKQAEPWVNLGFASLQEGNQGYALFCYNKALQLDPDMAQALLNRAAIYHMQGKDKEASLDLKQILIKDPKNTDVKNLLMTLMK